MKKALLLYWTIAFVTVTKAQDTTWNSYLYTDQVQDMAAEDEKIWIALFGGGIFSMDKKTRALSHYRSGNAVLPSHLIYDIAIAPNGDKWFATANGLAQLSNNQWSNYDHNNSALPFNACMSIAVDQKGIVWVVTADSGIVSYDGSTWQRFNFDNGEQFLPWRFNSIFIDRQNRKWFSGYSYGIFMYNDTDWYMRENYELGLKTDTRFFNTSEDSSGNIWLCTSTDVVVLTDTGHYILNMKNTPLQGKYIEQVVFDRPGEIWYIMYDAIARLKQSNWTIYSATDIGFNITGENKRMIFTGDTLWISLGSEGLLSFDGSTWKRTSTKTSELPIYGYNFVSSDKNKNIWAGGYYGVTKISKGSWKTYKTVDSDTTYPLLVNCFLEDSKGSLWLGTYSGLYEYKNLAWRKHRDAPTYNNILSLYEDPGGTVWVGTHNGIAKYNSTNWTKPPYYPDITGFKFINAITSQGATYYTATAAGVTLFDNTHSFIFTSSQLPGDDPYSNDIEIDKQGNKWIATRGGLLKFDNSSFTLFNKNNSGLPSDVTTTLYIDSLNRKWVGTQYGGLAMYNDTVWRVFDMKNSLITDNYITGITMPDRNNIWISTAMGLDHIQIAHQTDTADTTTGIVQHLPISNEFSIYPNPSKGTITVSCKKSVQQLEVILLNAQGKKVACRNIQNDDQLDLSSLIQGIYVIQVYSGEEFLGTSKWIKID